MFLYLRNNNLIHNKIHSCICTLHLANFQLHNHKIQRLHRVVLHHVHNGKLLHNFHKYMYLHQNDKYNKCKVFDLPFFCLFACMYIEEFVVVECIDHKVGPGLLELSNICNKCMLGLFLNHNHSNIRYFLLEQVDDQRGRFLHMLHNSQDHQQDHM